MPEYKHGQPLSRRDFLRLAGAGAGLVTILPVIQACAPSAAPAPTAAPAAEPTKVPEATKAAEAAPTTAPAEPTATTGAAAEASPTAATAAAQATPTTAAAAEAGAPNLTWKVTDQEVTIQADMFLGGWKEQIYREAADELTKNHPNIKVNFTFDPRIWEQLRPKLVAGEPPDLSYYGWGIDMAAAVVEGQVRALDDALDWPSYDTPGKTWRQTFPEGALEDGTFDGKTYLLPQSIFAYGLWYDEVVFKENNWSIPKSWDEFLALCETIKGSGKMAPICYTGKYPSYWGFGFLEPLIYKLGGKEVNYRIDNLEEGAWKDPAVLKAASLCQELKQKGYIMEGTEALSHTESQMEWLNHRAAMIPCGSWLESEMSGNIPEGFQMRVMPVPSPADAKEETSVIKRTSGPDFAVFTKAQHPNEAIEYLRTLLSVKFGKRWTELTSSPPVIMGGTEGVKVSNTLKSVIDLMAAAKTTFDFKFLTWYQPMATEYANHVGKLMLLEITPEQFADNMEAEAKKMRDDEKIYKRKRQG